MDAMATAKPETQLQSDCACTETTHTESLALESSMDSGQFGIRHLVGLITVIAVVLAFSASRLRAMTAVEAAQVGIHWLYVLAIVGGGFAAQSYWRRKKANPAGALLLRVWQRSITPSRRRWTGWLLTAAVIVDGIFISLAVGPGKTISEAMQTPWILSVLIQMPLMEGGLWLAWIHNCLSGVNVMEFRQHGLLFVSNRFTGFFPWQSVSRMYWSSLRKDTLVIFTKGSVMNLPINPASRGAVTKLLEQLPGDHQPPASSKS